MPPIDARALREYWRDDAGEADATAADVSFMLDADRAGISAPGGSVMSARQLAIGYAGFLRGRAAARRTAAFSRRSRHRRGPPRASIHGRARQYASTRRAIEKWPRVAAEISPAARLCLGHAMSAGRRWRDDAGYAYIRSMMLGHTRLITPHYRPYFSSPQLLSFQRFSRSYGFWRDYYALLLHLNFGYFSNGQADMRSANASYFAGTVMPLASAFKPHSRTVQMNISDFWLATCDKD